MRLHRGPRRSCLKRTALADLAPTVEAVRRGETYVSPFARSPPCDQGDQAGTVDWSDEPRPGSATTCQKFPFNQIQS